MEDSLKQLTADELEHVFGLKYGVPPESGSDPELRKKFGYYNPDDHYEALVNRLVVSGSHWLDVGCGRDIFPSNKNLAKILAERCDCLVGVDPDPNVHENPFLDERYQGMLETYSGESGRFDLITLRMVAEHVERPDEVFAAIARLLRSGGMAIIYTVNRFSPMPLLTTVTPMSVRHPLKKFLWGTDEKDTFPTCFRMNTRRKLLGFANDAGFREVLFDHLDDCRTLARFRILLYCELIFQKACRSVGAHYPENCLMGAYEKL